jgi:hypothetical protein
VICAGRMELTPRARPLLAAVVIGVSSPGRSFILAVRTAGAAS